MNGDRPPLDSFSAGYGEARTKFVDAAAAQGGALERVTHPARGPDGADLSMDIAWLGDRSASKVFVTFSGVHGVEGFFGSAVQVEWLRRGENRRLPQDTAALLIHAGRDWCVALPLTTEREAYAEVVIETLATHKPLLRVPGWLATPSFRMVVASHDHAARNHGGSGALYVRLRRNRL